jgi:hypothetical protein
MLPLSVDPDIRNLAFGLPFGFSAVLRRSCFTTLTFDTTFSVDHSLAALRRFRYFKIRSFCFG